MPPARARGAALEIHQVIDTAAPGDAIMNDALAIRAQLRQACRSDIVCDRIGHPGLTGEVIPTSLFSAARRHRGAADDVLIVHASIGNEHLHGWIQTRPERLVIRYHNITPAAFFRSTNAGFADLLDAGRHQLAALVSRAEAAIADSAFNADELAALGMDRLHVHVVPPFFPFDGYAARARPPEQKRWPTPFFSPDGTHDGYGPDIVFVGQLLPHKRPDLLLAAFHVLFTHLDPRARLTILGPARQGGYASAVFRMADELRLPIDFAGAVDQATLEARVADAHVMVTTSEHEGFCVPVVEAMAAGSPVVARRFAALPETIGSAGLVLEASDDALVLAEAIVAAATAAPIRDPLVRAGFLRAAELSPARSAQRFWTALGAIFDLELATERGRRMRAIARSRAPRAGRRGRGGG